MLIHIEILVLESLQRSHTFTLRNLCDVCLTLCKALLLKNANVRSNVLSMRISHLSVVIGGMFLFWFWGAQLKSYLTSPLKTLPFQNLEEFLTKSNKKVRFVLQKMCTAQQNILLKHVDTYQFGHSLSYS